jgi:hypothetical protein
MREVGPALRMKATLPCRGLSVKAFFLAAVAQNLKRLVRFLRQPKTPILPAAT